MTLDMKNPIPEFFILNGFVKETFWPSAWPDKVRELDGRQKQLRKSGDGSEAWAAFYRDALFIAEEGRAFLDRRQVKLTQELASLQHVKHGSQERISETQNAVQILKAAIKDAIPFWVGGMGRLLRQEEKIVEQLRTEYSSFPICSSHSGNVILVEFDDVTKAKVQGHLQKVREKWTSQVRLGLPLHIVSNNVGKQVLPQLEEIAHVHGVPPFSFEHEPTTGAETKKALLGAELAFDQIRGKVEVPSIPEQVFRSFRSAMASLSIFITPVIGLFLLMSTSGKGQSNVRYILPLVLMPVMAAVVYVVEKGRREKLIIQLVEKEEKRYRDAFQKLWRDLITAHRKALEYRVNKYFTHISSAFESWSFDLIQWVKKKALNDAGTNDVETKMRTLEINKMIGTMKACATQFSLKIVPAIEARLRLLEEGVADD